MEISSAAVASSGTTSIDNSSDHHSPPSSSSNMPKRKRQRRRPRSNNNGQKMPTAALAPAKAAGAPRTTNIHELIRARQKHGRVRFVSRVACGTWSPDALQQGVGRNGSFLRRLKLSGPLLKGHRGCVNTVTATPDGKFWITGSDDLRVKVSKVQSQGMARG